jgi:hypothetical protein
VFYRRHPNNGFKPFRDGQSKSVFDRREYKAEVPFTADVSANKTSQGIRRARDLAEDGKNKVDISYTLQSRKYTRLRL